MIVDCFFIAWNESETIHLTIKHYQSFCRKVIVYDNFSTDNTREIAEAMGCEVRLFGVEGSLDDREYLKVKNNCWKGSDADWVIVCDADEILFMLDPINSLRFCKEKGITIVKSNGISIYSNTLPSELWTEVHTGINDDSYSKLVCFRPDKINEIGYIYGCHEAKPEGEIKYFNDLALLLHYKYVGGIERVLKRHRLYKERLSPINKRFNLGHVYSMDEREQIDNFKMNLEAAKEIF